MWSLETSNGNESAKCKYDIVPFTRGRGLDLGCGPFKAYKHFIGVDNGHHARAFGWPIHPDMSVEDATDLSVFGTESMDFVFSSHLLEHIEDVEAALEEWWRVLKVGGHLCLYLPHKDFYPNIGQYGANPDHKHDFLPADIWGMMKKAGKLSGWKICAYEDRNGENEYSFFQVYQKRDDGVQSHSSSDLKKYKKTVCICRFGGFGDMIQASSIFPELKRQGYHLTVMTTPKGHDIIKHDQNVDAWLIQDNDQVPNNELSAYWKHQAAKYDRFINLSESVEGTLLAMPGRINHAWPDEMRRKELGRNYLEFTAEIAGVEYNPEPDFYATEHEECEAQLFIGKCAVDAGIEHPYLIMLTLAGSSVHKMYPGQDAVIAQILLGIPNAIVILCGDASCKLLEEGWQHEPRVVCTSGEMSIRQTLTLAQRMDCVVGPETGVLNAVAFNPVVSKVCLLSHSSHENLTRDWVNSIAIAPNVPCYPCHRLHYGREFCPHDEETGAAICAASIPPDLVFKAIEAHHDAR